MFYLRFDMHKKWLTIGLLIRGGKLFYRSRKTVRNILKIMPQKYLGRFALVITYLYLKNGNNIFTLPKKCINKEGKEERKRKKERKYV